MKRNSIKFLRGLEREFKVNLKEIVKEIPWRFEKEFHVASRGIGRRFEK